MDLDIHVLLEEHKGLSIEEIEEKCSEGYWIQLTGKDGMLREFRHLFGGGYAAMYFSYMWAEVLDADAFTRFKNEGVMNPKTGRDFRRCILSQGNSRPAEELFRDFMGRDPDLKSLLKRAGIQPKTKQQ
jgi:oligopeptidase A